MSIVPAFFSNHNYRGSKKITVLQSPGRLLWYVTKKTGVRACARLDEVVYGPARILFQQYKHLGIYDWDAIMRLTKNDPDKNITAFRFSDPQLFTHTVTFKELTEICQGETGNEPPIYSVSPIPAAVFVKVYRLGMGLPE